MTNLYPGLARGPIDHQSSSVINAISFEAIEMGSLVKILPPDIPVLSNQLLPVIQESPGGNPGAFTYGVVVGGDADGIYGDGNVGVNDLTRAALGANQGVAVCTQGRCLAKVDEAVNLGDKLSASNVTAQLEKAGLNDFVIATALQNATAPAPDMIAVDIQREGIFT